ncbi:3-oxoacyl-ACP synthase [Oleiphilus messinensis]|uniref:3-oxoacyl-ACP synthase n=2 Tax=Oleiphilus messinensis TaxID=141451 RepID=A0A1Y0IE82_9GAMM|nr:3-oxoacyl-ACP synthase [Oleiphilus messinensis]
MLKLAVLAYQDVLKSRAYTAQLPLFLGAPERRDARSFPLLEPFIRDLHLVLGSQGAEAIELDNSEVFPEGKASGYLALKAAFEYLDAGRGTAVVVGGVDTFFDGFLLSMLLREQRLLTLNSLEGFIPGEGAAFLIIEKVSAEPETSHILLGPVGIGQEPGHHYSAESCLAGGLTQAFDGAISSLAEPIATVCCGNNGESKQIKEWGMSSIRFNEKFLEHSQMLHPADGYGELGAATAPTLIGLSAMGLLNQYYSGPILTWAASDFGLRGAVAVSLRT